jgi:PAS domain S-box-containing protein
MAKPTAPADPQLRRLLVRASFYPAALSVAVAVALGWQVKVLRDTAAWVDHTDVVIARANDVARLQLERETALRGYLIARAQPFLDAYEAADRALDPALGALKALVADNRPQQESAGRLQQLADEWELRAASALRASGEPTLAPDAVLARARIMDAFRAETRRFTAVEEALRTARSSSAQRASWLVLASMVLLSLGVGAALAFLARSQLRTVAAIHGGTARAAEERAQALAESEERFRLFVEGVRDSAIYLLDRLGNVVSWNAGAERIKGWRPGEIVGRHFSVFYTVEDVAAGLPERELAAAERDGQTEGESWRVRKDGSRFWAAVTLRALRDADGRLAGYAKLVRDTTERKRAEMRRAAQYALAEALAPARTVAEALPSVLAGLGTALGYELVLAWEPRGERLACSASWLRPSSRGDAFIGFVRGITFRRGEGVAGGAWESGEADWVEDIRQSMSYAHAPQAVEAGLLSALVFPVRAAGETALVLQLFAGDPRPRDPELLDAVGPLALQLGTFVERVRQQEAAREAERARAAELERRVAERTIELTAVNRELEAFSYSVSHDLRAPLRALDGFSQVLLEDYGAGLDAQGKDYLARIRAASQRMSRLIDDLIQLSRVTRSELRRDDVDLSAVFEQAVEEVRERDRGRAVEVIVERGVHVRGDERLLRAGIVNLVGNAFKFTRDQAVPRVEFGVTPSKDGRVYHVRDNGAGFDMAYARKLFQPFQRLHSDAEFEGTGIGLATWQRIVHRHGGRVWAEGERGRGATFFFTLGDY